MKTENVLSTTKIERVGTVSITRVIDFAKLAKASKDGRIDVEALTSGGDWGVKVQPLNKSKEAVTHDVAGQSEADAFIAGMMAVSALKARGPRNGTAFDPATVKRGADLMALTRENLRTLTEHLGLTWRANDSKSHLAAAAKGKLPK